MSNYQSESEFDFTEDSESDSSDSEVDENNSSQFPNQNNPASEDMFAGFEENANRESENEEMDFEDFEDNDDAGVSHSSNPPTQVSWTWTKDSQPLEPSMFTGEDDGWLVNFDDSTTEFEFLQMTLTQEIISFCTGQMNLYAQQVISDSQNLSRRQQNWRPVQNRDFIRFLAVRIIMGIVKKPHYSHYWTKEPLLSSPMVAKIMSSDRFSEILRYLHFCDNSKQISGDKLFKIRELWELAFKNFATLREPAKNLSVDESLIKFKGRLGFKQFIPSKRSRFGIKTFSIVDSNTGFILNSIIYGGKQKDAMKFDMKTFGYGGSILLELAEPYFYKSHQIFADNYFNSPAVAQKLLERGTYLCGTLRSNRKNLPKIPKLRKGEIVQFVSNQPHQGIMYEAWRDRKIVRMISTGIEYGSTSVTSKAGVTKSIPNTILVYNKQARGIDLADMQMHFLDFRMQLVRGMLEITGGIHNISSKPGASELPLRLTDRHFPSKSSTPQQDKIKRRRCHLCYIRKGEKGRRTTFCCNQCNVPLCVFPCFEEFHTKKNLK